MFHLRNYRGARATGNADYCWYWSYSSTISGSIEVSIGLLAVGTTSDVTFNSVDWKCANINLTGTVIYSNQNTML